MLSNYECHVEEYRVWQHREIAHVLYLTWLTGKEQQVQVLAIAERLTKEM